MINLIASDIDGTLLQNGEKEISPAVFECIDKLYEQGVVFAAASGRQYPNLRRLFKGVEDKIAYICENGALIMYKDKVISRTPVERFQGIELMKDIWNRGNCEILLSGEKTSYLMPKKESYVIHMRDQVKNNVTIINSLEEVSEPFLKISVYNEQGIDFDSDYFADRWSDKFTTAVSGNCWMDFTNKFVNKGNALVVLQKLFGTDRDTTMVFGDNYNDIDMFKESNFSYAMHGADPEIRQTAAHIAYNVESVLSDVLKMR